MHLLNNTETRADAWRRRRTIDRLLLSSLQLNLLFAECFPRWKTWNPQSIFFLFIYLTNNIFFFFSFRATLFVIPNHHLPSRSRGPSSQRDCPGEWLLCLADCKKEKSTTRPPTGRKGGSAFSAQELSLRSSTPIVRKRCCCCCSNKARHSNRTGGSICKKSRNTKPTRKN